MTLAHRAVLCVTEEPFCEPWLAGARALCKARFTAAVWLVDASCIVPASLVPRSACSRAGSFDSSTRARRQRALRGPLDSALAPENLQEWLAQLPAPTGQLPFASVPLDDLPHLLDECGADATVASLPSPPPPPPPSTPTPTPTPSSYEVEMAAGGANGPTPGRCSQ